MDAAPGTNLDFAPQDLICGLKEHHAPAQETDDARPLAIPDIRINVRQLTIVCDGVVLPTRSRALMVFVCCLVRQKRSQPNAPWIGIDVLRAFLPSVHGRQMQRFIDALDTICFPICYETKTAGRYCLDASAALVRFDIDDLAIDAFIDAPGKGRAASPRATSIKERAAGAGRSDGAGALTSFKLNDENDDLLTSLARISLADAQFHDGNLDSGNDHAYELWRRLIETAEPEIKATALLRLARVCRRLQRYGEAQEALRKLQKMVRCGEIGSGALEYKSRLCLAMLRYEQGRVDDARAIVGKLDMAVCSDDSTLGEYYNLMGLLADDALRAQHQAALDRQLAPAPTVLPALLEIAAKFFKQALTLIVRTNDYQSLQRTCFNFGHLYIRAHWFAFPMPNRERLLDRGVRWIAQSEFISNKFGVGMDSLWSRIVLLRSALDGGLDLNDLNSRCGGMFKNHGDLESMAQATREETVRVGNRLEEGSALAILAEIARRKGDAVGGATFQQQALDLYRKLNRPDLARALNYATRRAAGS